MDTNPGVSVMSAGGMETNYGNYSAYPDPSTMDFNDPSFQLFNIPKFNDAPSQAFVDPAIIHQQPLTQPGQLQNIGVNEHFNYLGGLIDIPVEALPQNNDPSYIAHANNQMAFQLPHRGQSPLATLSPPSENSFLESTPDLFSNETPPTDVSSSNNSRPGSSEEMESSSLASFSGYQPPSHAGPSSVPNNAVAPITAPKKTPQKRGRKPKPKGTKEEQEKDRERFLERNRLAALKCRTKKKAMDAEIQQMAQSLTGENQLLRATFQVLCSELEGLVQQAKEHTKGKCGADDVQAVVQKAAAVLEESKNWAPAPFSTRGPSSEEEEMDEEIAESIDFNVLDEVHH